jgi:ethanolamine ammonia-lyase small subunit
MNDELAHLSGILRRTPARLLVGRAGSSYRTSTQLQLRSDHAFARDAVQAELDAGWLAANNLRELHTMAGTKAEHLLRPDLGRRLCDDSRQVLATEYPRGAQLQLVVGDGLSATAVVAQVPRLLPLLHEGAARRGRSVGKPFAIRYCRVGVLNDIGDVLQPQVVILLIGERPGLATADSLSAYMAFQPRSGHTDAQRNLISNIHSRGIGHAEAAERILALGDQMMHRQKSGVAIKESMPDSVHTLN